MKKLIVIALIAINLFLTKAEASNTVTVFAASSLTESFTQIGKRFEKSHSGIKIIFSFQASSTLAAQIKAGAPADIFVSAEPFSGGEDYLVNRVVLGVPKLSPINKISDLNGKYLWIQCAHEVPCGKTANAALVGENVTSNPISLEPKVSSAVAKLVAGEVDAAIIFKTDVLANRKKLRAIEFSNTKAASTTYQIVQLKKNRWASTFMNYLQSRTIIKTLNSKGFDAK